MERRETQSSRLSGSRDPGRAAATAQPHFLPAADNPFAASRLRPGAIPYVFSAGLSRTQLLETLRRNQWWGQIVGPHGSGKSALLAALLPAVRGLGREPLLIELHDAQRRLPVDLRRINVIRGETVVVVDGYEQLGLWSRWRLKRFCRRNDLGLVVTSHRPLGLPELCRTQPSLELARQVVKQLLAERDWQVDDERLAAAFTRHRGNLRELLFELYDWFEQDRPRRAGAPGRRAAS